MNPVARTLARVLLDSSWTASDLAARILATLPPGCIPPAQANALVAEILAVHRRPHSVRPGALAGDITQLREFDAAYARAREAGIPWKPQPVRLIPTRMALTAWPSGPSLPDEAAVSAWLRLPLNEIAWLADTQHRNRRETGALQPYHATSVPRRQGPPRLIEAPNSLLKTVQRRINTLPIALGSHPAAHGFVPGRSPLTHAQNHVGQRRVLTIDLRDFFTHITARRVFGLLFTAGYPEEVAHLIAGLSTTATSIGDLARMPAGGSRDQRTLLRARLREPHLPQGSPSSPAWSNAICYRLDRRLSGLAASLGAHYSRYADDLTFSGDQLPDLAVITEIIRNEGFAPNPAKTRNLGRGQQQRVTGVVVNDRPNTPRREYEQLKAILHDAATNGAEQANRLGVANFADHLRGRIEWVAHLNPVRGRKLLATYAEIAFSGTESP